MRSFPLQIVTADGMVFDGQAESISVRAAGGDMSVQAGHCDYVTVLGMGQVRLIVDGKVRTAACIGGMLAVADGKVRHFEAKHKRSLIRIGVAQGASGARSL